jgi:hypothetical protein
MTIASLDDYIASAKQRITFTKTAAVTTVAAAIFSVFDKAGDPGAGTLAGTSTTVGVVPTDATAGYPTINAFAGGATGYLSRFGFTSSVASRQALYDRLFLSGAHAFNAADTLGSQPSFASRVPGGDYKMLELWVEAATAFTGIPVITVTYTNQDGVAGRTTGAVTAPAALTVNRCFQLPLQAGDTGIQKVESVTCGTATVGTFNVMVLRPLAEARVPVASYSEVQDMLKTGLPEVYADSALYLLVTADSTSSGIPSLHFEIANK